MVPVVYFLGGVLVRAATKKIAQRLVAKGFRKATKGQISSKIKVVDGTENNLISLITRALAKIKGDKPKTPSGPAPRGANQKPVPQSRIRNKGPEKLKNYGPTGSLPKRVPKKPLAVPKAPPKPVTTSKSTIPKRIAQIANIGAGAAIAKVAYDAYKDDKVSEKDLEVLTTPRSGLSTEAQDAIKKLNVEIKKPRRKVGMQVAKESSAQGSAAKPTPRQSAKFADTPARKAAIMRALKEAIALGKK